MSGPGTVSCSAAGPASRRDSGSAALAALAPVREAMLHRAHDHAAEIVAQARGRADEMLATAGAEAARSVAQARETGRQQAIPLSATQSNRGRRDAQSIRLRAQREAYEEFRAQVHAAVSKLRDEPGYGPLRRRLSEMAVRLAGPGAALTEDPGGGVIARAPGIMVDCSLPRLADAAIEALGSQVVELWAPEQGDRS
jgi:vacuolar-type H+-ATPase subunit E/Vma4